ncbi:MAG: MGMT family protein [Chloroflexi bacterium]|nr:MGMT family protein [Chloroflexota bacterium]
MRSELSFYVVDTEVGFVGLVLSEHGLRHTTLPRNTRGQALTDVAELGATRAAAESEVNGISTDVQTLGTGRHADVSQYVDWAGVTPFQRAVLQQTMRIPIGQTRSYGEIAELAGSPRAARAVGRVMATNPLPFIVPCHRVIGSDGTLHGYGGGLDLKERLLRAEGARV